MVSLWLFFSFFLIVFGAVKNINPYDVLKVPRTATQGEIRAAYKSLAMQYHPDKNLDEDAATIFSTISAAYDLIGTPDKRAVYDDFGRSDTGFTGFYSYWEFVQSNTQSDQDFYVGDQYITRLTQELWDERVQGDTICFYAPWCIHCQQKVASFKSVAGMLDGVVEFGAFNCHKQPTFCKELTISAYPTFTLFYPKLHFQMNMPLPPLPLEEIVPPWIKSNSAEWKRLGSQSFMVELDNITTFDEKVLKSEELWIVAFVGGSRTARVHSDSARMNLVRLSANLRGLAFIGIVDCGATWGLCVREFSPKAITWDSFPLFRVYARGSIKTSEELFTIQTVPVHVACEMIEKLVQMLMANEKICKNGVCTAVTPAFQEGYKPMTEDKEEKVPEPARRGYQDAGDKTHIKQVQDGRRPNLLSGY